VSFAAITLCVASQRVSIVTVVVYFVIDSGQKLLDTPFSLYNKSEDYVEFQKVISLVILR
jgi:hypothetical protein